MMDMQQVVQDQDSKRVRAIDILVKELVKHPSIAKSIEKGLAADFEEKPKNLKDALMSRFLTNAKIM